jgi:hypothetical protein
MIRLRNTAIGFVTWIFALDSLPWQNMLSVPANEYLQNQCSANCVQNRDISIFRGSATIHATQ